MKLKKKLPLLGAALLILWLFSGCASTEAPVEEEVVQETTEEEGTTQTTAIDRTRVSEAKNSADTARFDAENAKAPKAAPQEFEAAVALYEEGESLDTADDLEGAYEAYSGAAQGFKAAKETADTRREEALRAMNDADAAISNAEKSAQEAAEEAEQEEN